jgi:hypothetical protein
MSARVESCSRADFATISAGRPRTPPCLRMDRVAVECAGVPPWDLRPPSPDQPQPCEALAALAPGLGRPTYATHHRALGLGFTLFGPPQK